MFNSYSMSWHLSTGFLILVSGCHPANAMFLHCKIYICTSPYWICLCVYHSERVSSSSVNYRSSFTLSFPDSTHYLLKWVSGPMFKQCEQKNHKIFKVHLIIAGNKPTILTKTNLIIFLMKEKAWRFCLDFLWTLVS